jgi:hypothetical protein
MGDGEHFPFLSLDFLYMPSSDVAGDVEYFTGVLGGRLEFAIEAFGTRVAMVRLSPEAPRLLFAGHLEGERPVLVYRVDDLDRAVAELQERGWDPAPQFGIPHGPACELRTPGGHRIALYELTRPEADARLAGRRDY